MNLAATILDSPVRSPDRNSGRNSGFSDMNQLEAFRTCYARLVTGIAGVPADATAITKAFASVPRERFIGPGPWRIVTPLGYVSISSNDPAFLHQDFAVALKPDKQINNGQPSLHARCFAALQIKPGERVIHVGAGTGYYTALLAKLIGPNGSIVAYELETDLAERATANLAESSNLAVQSRSAVEGRLPECDVVYVNAGATAPLNVWVDSLRPGGRLLFPLTTAQGFGAMLLVTRTAENGFAARFVCQAAFIHCFGARDEETAEKLAEAFKTGGLWNFQRKGGLWDVQSLRRDNPPDGTCWFAGSGWWLSTAAPS
jgi:protein-L-isoaspartate(D-aspartate) O-methyltransferase